MATSKRAFMDSTCLARASLSLAGDWWGKVLRAAKISIMVDGLGDSVLILGEVPHKGLKFVKGKVFRVRVTVNPLGHKEHIIVSFS